MSTSQEVAQAAALLYTAASAVACLFLAALAAGAPWGELTMGGRHRGRLPPAHRVAAVLQAGLLAGLAVVVLSRAGVVLPGWSATAHTAVWGVVAVAALSLALNLATPSRKERLLWAPVAFVLLATSLLVALGPAA